MAGKRKNHDIPADPPPVVEKGLATLDPPPPAGVPKQQPELEALCAHIAAGGSLRQYAHSIGRPPSGVLQWVRADEERHKAYRQAREEQADALADELIELADAPVPVDAMGRTDTGAVQQRRMQIDTRKWIASKLRPTAYGDKLSVDAKVETPDLNPEDAAKRVLALMQQFGLLGPPGMESTHDHSFSNAPQITADPADQS